MNLPRLGGMAHSFRRPRVGATSLPLGLTRYGPADMVVSGYPQIYPHKTAERIGTIGRRKKSPLYRLQPD